MTVRNDHLEYSKETKYAYNIMHRKNEKEIFCISELSLHKNIYSNYITYIS